MVVGLCFSSYPKQPNATLNILKRHVLNNSDFFTKFALWYLISVCMLVELVIFAKTFVMVPSMALFLSVTNCKESILLLALVLDLRL